MNLFDINREFETKLNHFENTKLNIKIPRLPCKVGVNNNYDNFYSNGVFAKSVDLAEIYNSVNNCQKIRTANYLDIFEIKNNNLKNIILYKIKKEFGDILNVFYENNDYQVKTIVYTNYDNNIKNKLEHFYEEKIDEVTWAHRDTNMEPTQLAFMIYLNDVNKKNGCFNYILGSHLEDTKINWCIRSVYSLFGSNVTSHDKFFKKEYHMNLLEKYKNASTNICRFKDVIHYNELKKN